MLYLLLIACIPAVLSVRTSGTARNTYYTSYPKCCDDPSADQTECRDYNGCKWAGYFACTHGKQTREWVESNNIVAFYDDSDPNGDNFKTNYCNKRVKLTKTMKDGSVKSFEAKVVDTCGNSDCNYCCQKNSLNGVLVDLEKNTALRNLGSLDEAGWGEIKYEFLD